MKKQREYTKFESLQVVDIKILLNVSYSKANRIMKDIKQSYKIPNVLYCHFLDYFSVPS